MKTGPDKLTSPENWAEWFDKCALAICGEETKSRLGNFANKRYAKALEAARGALKRPNQYYPAEAYDLLKQPAGNHACWYDLEASYWHGGRKHGAKAYKKYCCEIAASKSTAEEGRDFLEAYTTKFMVRTRCRTIIQKSLPRLGGAIGESGQNSEDVALNQAANDSLTPFSLDSDSKIEARKVFDSLSSEERVLLLAKLNEVPLHHPEIAQWLGLKKSAIYQRYKVFQARLANLLEYSKPGADNASSACGKILLEVEKILLCWAKTPECELGECLINEEHQQ